MTGRIALLGGSFDPVHVGHVALGAHFAHLLQTDQLRVIPAGSPWQKSTLQASPRQRADMVRLAFADQPFPLVVDLQEIERSEQGQPTYTIDTLRQGRGELGPQASIAFLMGADQLQNFGPWRDWRALFDYAHFCVAARPAFALASLAPDGSAELPRRLGRPEQSSKTPRGLNYLDEDLAVD